MFQSITYTYASKDAYLFELVDSDFGKVFVRVVHRPSELEAIIVEYSKRELNVAANLIRYFHWVEKRSLVSMTTRLEWAKSCPYFTSKLKADIDKYLVLI